MTREEFLNSLEASRRDFVGMIFSEGLSLSGIELKIRGNLNLRSITVEGDFDLGGVYIEEGDLDLSGATIRGTLRLVSATVGGGLYLVGANIENGLNLQSATVVRDLYLTGANIGKGVYLQNSIVGGNIFCAENVALGIKFLLHFGGKVQVDYLAIVKLLEAIT